MGCTGARSYRFVSSNRSNSFDKGIRQVHPRPSSPKRGKPTFRTVVDYLTNTLHGTSAPDSRINLVDGHTLQRIIVAIGAYVFVVLRPVGWVEILCGLTMMGARPGKEQTALVPLSVSSQPHLPFGISLMIHPSFHMVEILV